LAIRCDYTVDGKAGTITGPVPCTVTIRGRDIVYTIRKEGRDVLEFQVTVDGEVLPGQSVHTPGGSYRYHQPARRFWMELQKSPSTSAD
jgi:hypothetical protein